ncbi:MAG TPA: Na+/H+ antiporter NhaA [Longimicrobiales bacterium]|nr:Na+/H+ antiporter NhaA [Longimicrobiales bacterium]
MARGRRPRAFACTGGRRTRADGAERRTQRGFEPTSRRARPQAPRSTEEPTAAEGRRHSRRLHGWPGAEGPGPSRLPAGGEPARTEQSDGRSAGSSRRAGRLFAPANAGLQWSPDVLTGHERLVMAIIFALVLGKSVGIVAGAWLAVRAGIAVRPSAYGWRQVAGAGALAGIGFTMSLFIAGRSLSGADFVAAKTAVFVASLAAGTAGTAILWKRTGEGAVVHVERGTPVAAAW